MKARKVRFKEGRIILQAVDGREGSLPMRLFPRLYSASEEQRQNFTLSHFGIHWPELDEDLSYDGFFAPENPEAEENPIGRVFREYPELNVRQIARSIGINASLMQQYVDGYKTASPTRRKQIEQALHRLADELTAISL